MPPTTRKRKIIQNEIVNLISTDSESEVKNESSEADSDFETSLERKKRKRIIIPKTTVENTTEKTKETRKKSQKERTAENDTARFEDDGLNVPPSTERIVPASSSRRFNAKGNSTWSVHDLLKEKENIDPNSAKNIVDLFKNENTIPFICRYRRDLISDSITPEKLRSIKNTYQEILNLQKRANTIIEHLAKEKVLNNNIKKDILSAKTEEELEFLYAPYKPANKGSLADRAIALGLGEVAERILYGKPPPVNIEDLVDKKNPSLETVRKVIEEICHIVSHLQSKSTRVLEELRRLASKHKITLNCVKSKSKTQESPPDAYKYENYSNFELPVNLVKPHQTLAINRGEKAKVLSVKIVISHLLKDDMKSFIKNEFFSDGLKYPLRIEVYLKSFEECYTKKLQPYLIRHLRSKMTEEARKASIEVFAKNLKQLLLMCPLKGEKILGIDPGFSNGCKLAMISETADVLETAVLYPHSRSSNSFVEYGKKLFKILERNNCKIIAIGNGTACRETELWLTHLFEKGILDRDQIKYCIVSEQGASIYSCSDIARKEFPKMDINLISAVSIARRLNDPLSEYVKIEPRHIGVGMYQHDIGEKLLNEALNEVVTECVSFVGVDINTASSTILKHVAGLSAARAEKIVEYRLKHGPFKTRKDLIKVKNIGEKTFVQCAGFVRIEPRSIEGTVENLLDCTWVHPECYPVAEKIISMCNLSSEKIGESEFIKVIKNFCNSTNISELEKKFNLPKERIKIILDALQRDLYKDYRSEWNNKPLFKQGILKMTDLKENTPITGAVNNVTHFGAFVDIGVEQDALIHTSNMNGFELSIGNRVEAEVLNVDARKKRIQLRMKAIIS